MRCASKQFMFPRTEYLDGFSFCPHTHAKIVYVENNSKYCKANDEFI